jgi:hypothetical protein
MPLRIKIETMSDNGLQIMSEDAKAHDSPSLGDGWTTASAFNDKIAQNFLAFGHWQPVASGTRVIPTPS